ncbi:fatty-acid--CoA ligase [Nocardia donostiensis]|uniref:acyl-CoA synthetase n=1 Tax=Nocardia donostiensis TaxID=1538463 RepID=UPI0009D91A86|nr:long-chain fatty acid--CoA ligase [Nocardia donostiensis]OQS17320.1 fatty-acid--CoA ligase [Nocardia donostiensis]
MYLTQGLHRAVTLDPGGIATIHGDRVRTFAEQADRVSRFAAGLSALGVRPGDRVGMLAFNSDRYIEYLLATCWVGGVINTVNIRWSVAEIADSINDCDTRILCVDNSFADLADALREHCSGLKHIVHCDDGPPPDGLLGVEDLIGSHAPVEDERRGGDQLAALFYTGGTTGRAKGVMLSHDNLLASALGSISTCGFAAPGGAMLHAAPMFHLGDLTGWVAHTLLGNTHVVIPRFDPVEVLRAVHQHSVTDLLLVATMVQMVFEHPDADTVDLSSLRRLVYGAAPIPATVLEHVLAKIPQLEFIQTYGMTELSPVATILTPDDHRAGGDRLRSVGRAAVHCEVRVVDRDDRPVAPGVVGEVAVRGDGVMHGYWNLPDITAEALRGGWMHTGDGGYLDADGYLFLVDRIKDMIITGGENVYSIEVENAVIRHPGVAACAVVGVPDDRFGERVHAVVVPRPGTRPEPEEIRAFTKTFIAGYKVPRSISFTAELPLSAAGKVLKHVLRERLASADATDTL